jgi:hypothetical protein
MRTPGAVARRWSRSCRDRPSPGGGRTSRPTSARWPRRVLPACRRPAGSRRPRRCVPPVCPGTARTGLDCGSCAPSSMLRAPWSHAGHASRTTCPFDNERSPPAPPVAPFGDDVTVSLCCGGARCPKARGDEMRPAAARCPHAQATVPSTSSFASRSRRAGARVWSPDRLSCGSRRTRFRPPRTTPTGCASRTRARSPPTVEMPQCQPGPAARRQRISGSADQRVSAPPRRGPWARPGRPAALAPAEYSARSDV